MAAFHEHDGRMKIISAKVFKGSTTSVFPERSKKYGLGSTTAREMVEILEKLHDGKLVSSDACKAMLEHLKNDTTDQFEKVESFEAAEFTDPDLAARERDLVFGRVPTIVAHGSEIPKAFDFKTVRMPRNNVIIARQRDGGVKAMVNLCRHRGALLECEASGRRRLFSCPYHRWSYDIDGKLRTVTRDNTFGDLDRGEAGLIELPNSG